MDSAFVNVAVRFERSILFAGHITGDSNLGLSISNVGINRECEGSEYSGLSFVWLGPAVRHIVLERSWTAPWKGPRWVTLIGRL